MKAMILAAGLGTRLLPYTLKRPKPLFPVLNKPLLQLTAARIARAGFSEIVINCHHLRDQIVEVFKAEKEIVLQQEKEILGTGGGLRKALPHFDNDPVLVVNGDIYHSIDYRDVYSFHNKSNYDATLVLHEYPRFNDVRIDDDLMVTDFSASEESTGRVLAFTGIHVVNPEILETIPENTPFCIIDCYRKLLEKGGKIKAYFAKDRFWTDMGTPEDYLKLHEGLLKGHIPLYEELNENFTEAPFIGSGEASAAGNPEFLDWVCIGKGATIGSDTTLQRSVIWDGADVPAGTTVRDAIITA
jgi:mannose-1-phosphate guanylyltransferase